MSGLRILVIDDSLTIRKLVEIALRGTVHTVDYASTGGAGIAAARTGNPALVLCDFVLPDMKGLEVCRALRQDPDTEHIAFAVMTGKDAIRPLFAGLPVVDFLIKPFSADVVRGLVERVAQRPGPGFADGREVALAMATEFRTTVFDVLGERLARIPTWVRELGSESAATFFARKLFTESVLAELFESLQPLYSRPGRRPRDKSLIGEGGLDGFRPANLLEMIAAAGISSEFALKSDGESAVVRVVAGRLYPIPPATPRTMAELLRRSVGRFTWRRMELAADEVAGLESIPILQLRLECLRGETFASTVASTCVLTRVPGFSERLGQIHPNAEEQAILTMVDGVSHVAHVAARAQIGLEAACRAASRLIEIDLLRPRAELAGSAGSRLIVVVDNERQGFCDALIRQFADRHPNVTVRVVDRSTGLESLLEQHPAVLLINATQHTQLALDAARMLNARSDLAGLRLVATLEAADPVAGELTMAGCDAVLVKPLHVSDLDAMLGATASVTTTRPLRGT